MKNNKTIIIAIVLILAVVGLMIWATKGGVGNKATISDPLTYTGELSFSEPFYDFGDVSIKGGNVSHEFILSNDSLEAVKIGDVWTSCMCTEVFLSIDNKGRKGPFGMPGHSLTKKANLIVSPGEKLIVRAEFDPAAHGPTGIGMVEREVYLKVGKEDPVILGFTVVVTP